MKKPPPRLSVARATPPLIDCISEETEFGEFGCFHVIGLSLIKTEAENEHV